MFTVKTIVVCKFLKVPLFKNISCLRLSPFKSSIEMLGKGFKNISCLRLSETAILPAGTKINLKTFHVYG